MSDESGAIVQEAYERTDFEIVEAGPNLELPASTPARFSTSRQIDPAELVNRFDRDSYAPISEYIEDGYLSSKFLDCETNEFFHVKVWNNAVGIYPKDEDFSFETCKRAVERFQDLADLELIDDE